MRKAILVIDMPVSCSKCKFLYEFQGIKKCQLMNVLRGGASTLSQDNFTVRRHDKCPLDPMPEKKEVCGRYPQADGITPSYKVGWNDAIDAIGGKESD